MDDRKPHYALFDGDEVDGKRYALGDEIDASVDAGTLAYLIGIGRVGATPPAGVEKAPAGSAGLPDDSDPATMQAKVLADMDPASMTRDELIAHIGQLSTAEASDDDLRSGVLQLRERAARSGNGGEGNDGGGDAVAAEDRAFVAGLMPDVTAALAGVDDVDRLKRIRAAEVADKDRAGVTRAIDARIAALQAAA